MTYIANACDVLPMPNQLTISPVLAGTLRTDASQAPARLACTVMERNCSKCGSLSQFKDGHNPRQGYWCKKCRSIAAVNSSKKHRETKRKNNNSWHRRNSGNRAAATARWRANNQEKYAAHIAVQSAIRNGSIIPSHCEECGAKAHAHHDDYTKPLSIIWLCHTHHMERHTMLKAREQCP